MKELVIDISFDDISLWVLLSLSDITFSLFLNLTTFVLKSLKSECSSILLLSVELLFIFFISLFFISSKVLLLIGLLFIDILICIRIAFEKFFF
jgi:hypothetical protein